LMPKVCSVTSNRIRFSTTISVPQLDSAENTQVGESSELIAVLPEKKKRRRAKSQQPTSTDAMEIERQSRGGLGLSPVPSACGVIALLQVGGLHHRYKRRAA
jgi:hypothetical protein